MTYYIRHLGAGHPDELWKVDDEVARDVFAGDAAHGPAREFRARPGETAWNRMQAETPWFKGERQFHEMRLALGEHNPRIARPLFRAHDRFGNWSPSLHLEPEVVAASQAQARTLLRQLERISQTVQPAEENYKAFGHDIRNLLILACMEVETHWRGVLVANGAYRKAFKTTDYVALAEIMGLREYVVRFPAFPALGAISPFKGWGLGPNPTTDLPWYAAYNAVKHNRETEFKEANLQHAFQAISACAAMLVAQYGPNGLGWKTELNDFFQILEAPKWGFSECYVASPSRGNNEPAHTLFDPVNHPTLAAIQDKRRLVTVVDCKG